jgi:hypothetical protein
MPSAADELSSAPENPLICEFRALDHIINELGAMSASVLLIRKGRSIDLVYHWPDASELSEERLLCLHNPPAAAHIAPEPVRMEGPVGKWLKKLAPHVEKFVLFSSAVPKAEAVVAFGFRDGDVSAQPVRNDIANTARLIAMAAWRVAEVRRLRAELATVNERLRERKLIERAKAQLQAEHGFTEQEAYEHLRKISRQRRVPMTAVARSLIASVPV